MPQELAYALITPYSLLKSRTGGIISRLLFLTDLEFAGARLYRPSDEFVDRYIESIKRQSLDPTIEGALVGYINDYFRRDNRLGISNRTLLLLFRGENAVELLLRDVVGSFSSQVQGDTIRGTYGDFLVGTNGRIEFFEPAVLVATDDESNRRQLEIFADFAASDGGIVEDAVSFPSDEKPETTLVIIKPDSFRRRSARPGNMIDIFSKTGLYIVAAKLLRLSVAQAEDFYAPLKEIFARKLKGVVEKTLRKNLDDAFDFDISDDHYSLMTEAIKHENARYEFNRIVEYMCGYNEWTLPPGVDKNAPGSEKGLALLYRGVDAVGKIRERLGSTDPLQAAEGTIRSDFGYDIMKNGAHASDSTESAERERTIVGLWPGAESADVAGIIREYLAEKP